MAEEKKFRDKLIRAFGLEDIDDDDYEDEFDESYYPEEEAISQTETITQTVVSQPQPVQEESPDVLVLDPTKFDEAPGIVNKLKQNKTIVVNLKQTDYDEGRKIFDFLTGAVYALEGSINRIAESVFILAPKLIKVSTKMGNDTSTQNTQSSHIPNYED